MSTKHSVKAHLRNPLLSTHRGKEANKFQFDVVIERVYGASSSTYSVKWCRGVKTASTKQFTCNPKSPTGVSVGDKLSLLCTLYRSKQAPDKRDVVTFDAKDAKLSLISHKDAKKSAKTVGKVHFDLSEFAGVPSTTTKHTFQLNAKTRVDTTITCNFVRVSKGTGSSIGSGMSGMTVSSGEYEYDAGGNDDFSDMDLGGTASQAGEVLSPISAAEEADNLLAAVRSKDTASRIGSHANAPVSAKHGDRIISASRQATSKVSNSAAEHNSLGKERSKIVALELDIDKLQHQLADSKKETEKARVVNQMSEDIIRELREKIEYTAGNKSGKNRLGDGELQQTIDELQRKMVTMEVDQKTLVKDFEKRIKSLKSQADTLERGKKRLDREKLALSEKLVGLENALKTKHEGGDESEELLKQRDALQDQLEDLHQEVSNLRDLVRSEKDKNTEINHKLRETTTELHRVKTKLDAHEDHSDQIKITYEELSTMYNNLRKEHVASQAELRKLRVINAENSPDSPGIPKAATEKEKGSGFKRKLKIDKPSKLSRVDSGRTKEAEPEAEKLKRKIQDLQAELQDKNHKLVEAGRQKVDAEKYAASLQGDTRAATSKAHDAADTIRKLNESLDSSKEKYLNLSEQLEDALLKAQGHKDSLKQAQKKHKTDIESIMATYSNEKRASLGKHAEEMSALRKKHADEMASVRAKNKEEVKKYREAAAASATAEAADGGEVLVHVKQLEEALADASNRESKYEEEITRMTGIVNGLSTRLHEATVAVEAQQPGPKADGPTREVEHDYEFASFGSASTVHNEVAGSPNSAVVETCSEEKRLGVRTVCSRCGEKEELEGWRNSDPGKQSQKEKASGKVHASPPKETVEDDTFISSSSIRKVNLLEKITDGRLLNMLVETKMKLALAEEEKLGLEHLIRRVRDGDKHIQRKLAEHASKLEVKLNEANTMLASMQDEDKPSADAQSSRKLHQTMHSLYEQKHDRAVGSSGDAPLVKGSSSDSVIYLDKKKRFGRQTSAGTANGDSRDDGSEGRNSRRRETSDSDTQDSREAGSEGEEGSGAEFTDGEDGEDGADESEYEGSGSGSEGLPELQSLTAGRTRKGR